MNDTEIISAHEIAYSDQLNLGLALIVAYHIVIRTRRE